MLATIARSLPPDFRLTLADIGSAGGLHKRWRPIRPFVSALLFDPLDDRIEHPQDRHFPVALGAGAGEGVLHVTQRTSMSSLLEPNRAKIADFWFKPDHTRIVEEIPVKLAALDTLVAENHSWVDALKIDTQGAEDSILRGARACLNDQALLVEAELSFFDRYVGLRAFHEMVGFMGDHGFELIDLSRIKRYYFRNEAGVIKPGLGGGDRPGRIAFCDAIFFKRGELLHAQIEARHQAGDPHAALKAIILLLAYGKADMAAWLHDFAGPQVDEQTSQMLTKHFDKLAGVKFGRHALHLMLDYLARRV
jgi:FkbM family methyltransferase